MTTLPKRPWYREPLVWMIIAIPLSAVVAGIVTITIAVKTDDGLVVDDYYKKGKEINRVVERDAAAFRQGIGADFLLDADTGQILVTMEQAQGGSFPERLELRLMHATRPGMDRTMMLVASDSREYRGPLPELQPGHWHVQLAADDWRLLGSLMRPQENHLYLRASPP